MIIGIEGVSCVGKSSLAAELGRLLAAATVLPCYFHSVTDPSTLPPVVAATAGDQLAGLRQLLDVETVRRTRALAAQARGRTVVLDRTIDTLLAHTLAVDAIQGFGIADDAKALVEEHTVATPDVTLLLTAPYAVRRARAAHRSGMPELLYARDFAEHFLAHFSDPVTPLCVTLDGSQPLPPLVDQAAAVVGDVARGARPVRDHQATA